MANENETKLCKHCKTEIPKDAKVCPNCRKKQSGITKWIVVAVIGIVIIAAATSGGEEDTADTDTKQPNVVSEDSKATADTDASDTAKTEAEAEEDTDTDAQTEVEVSNVFNVGDVAELDQIKITFLSAEEYVSGNQFMQPKEGNMYYRIGFEVENIGDTDAYVSSWDWECYADGYSAEQAYFNDESLDATLSSGKKTKGYIFYEVPKDAQEVTLEYETNFWTENKIIFVIK